MGEDDIIEVLWKSGQVSRNSTTPSSLPPLPPSILRGSGSGGGAEENLQPTAPMHNQNLFIQEDEMVSWLHYSYHQPLYSSTPQSSISLTPPPSAPYDQSFTARRPENFMNFSCLRGTLYNAGGSRVGDGQSVPLRRESIQVGTSATSSSSATELCVIPATQEGTKSRVWPTLSVPSLARKEKEVAVETAGTPSFDVCKAETEPIQTQPAIQTEIADIRKPQEREETIAEIKGTEEAHGSTSRKRSRVAELHKLAARKRTEKINETMNSMKKLIPRCNKSTKASILDDALEYVKCLQNQIQICWKMQAGIIQQFMPYMRMGMMGMNQPPFTPFPWQHHISGLGPPYTASRVHLPTSQPQFPAYMNPYDQFVGLHHMQQRPPTLHSQPTSQPSFIRESSSKKLEDHNNQPKG